MGVGELEGERHEKEAVGKEEEHKEGSEGKVPMTCQGSTSLRDPIIQSHPMPIVWMGVSSCCG